MAFLCPSIGGRKPSSAGKYKVYTLKKARKRKLHTLKPLLPGGGHDMENMDIDQDDDSDSGISQAYSPAAVHSTLRMPDIAKTELASKLAAATSGSPAHIKARVLWKYEGVEPTDLNADKGEIVLLLYRDKSKVYAVNSKGKKGFIPFNYCSVLRKNDFVTNGSFSPAEQTDEDGNFRPVKVFFHDDFIKENDTNLFHSRNTRISEKQDSSSIPRCRSDESLFGRNKQKSRTRQLSSSLEELTDDNQTTSMVSSLIQWDRKAPETYRRRQKVKVTHFRKFENDAVMVLYDFQAADENDLDVCRGEVVTVLNRDDNDWWWVMKVDGAEGFIPSSYTSVEAVRFTDITPRSTDSTTSGSSESSMNQVRFQDPLCTIHSYIIEDSESDSDVNEPRDMEDDSMSDTGSADDLYFDSKFSTWC